MNIKSLLLAPVMALLAHNTQAQSVTYYAPVQSLTAAYKTYALPQFNPALGTLTGITIFTTNAVGNITPVGPVITGSLTLTNNDGEPLVIDDYFGRFQTRQLTLSTGYANTSQDIDPISTSPTIIGASIPSGGSQSFTISPGQAYSAISQTIGGSFFSTYTGAGTVSFQARAGQTIGTEGTDYTVQNFTNTPMTFGITYSFTPIPEPSSAALLGLGLAGLVFRRRR